jgi:hypothetical protein
LPNLELSESRDAGTRQYPSHDLDRVVVPTVNDNNPRKLCLREVHRDFFPSSFDDGVVRVHPVEVVVEEDDTKRLGRESLDCGICRRTIDSVR